MRGVNTRCCRTENEYEGVLAMSTEQKRAEESVTTSSSPVSVCLSAADIPGAYLSEPYETHAVPALRWWLLCRGLKVTDLLRQAGDQELRKSARSFVLSLVLALLALVCLPFIGEAYLSPKLTRGSFLESPSRKCLQHTRDWDFNWLSSTPNALSQLALLLGSLGKR